MALTPSRFCQTVAPSTIPPLTTYVAAGSMTDGSYPIENTTSAGSVTGRTCRATSVPVSTLTNAAIATADGLRVVAAGGRIDPPIVAAGVGRAVRTRLMPSVGPPVMTGSPTAFSHVLDPSTIVAKSA